MSVKIIEKVIIDYERMFADKINSAHITHWVRNNIPQYVNNRNGKKRWWILYNKPHGITYCFIDPIDATLFKLTWIEYI